MFHRKCDLLECNKESLWWKVFRGCGHSFHIECVLPDISVCKICESTLKEKNRQPWQGGKRRCVPSQSKGNCGRRGEESDEESETDDGTKDDDADELEVQSGEEVDELEQTINKLLQSIRMWQRPDIP